jgi:tRNA(His) 5'-end guanylyltransferase
MKDNYESRARSYLTRRVPVIMRLDGKAFHTYTKKLKKPFDEGLIEDMAQTAKYLCENIQGAKCAYVQSDEISILITDYDTLDTQAWFDYEVQKMCSISASIATAKFNQLRLERLMTNSGKWDDNILCEYGALLDFRKDMSTKFSLASFDSRVFNIPKEEVANYFLARQKDAVKNSISMLAQSLYSQKELHKKNQSDMQELCWQKGHNWNDLHWSKKRGSFVVKNTYINKELLNERFQKLSDKVYLKGLEEIVNPVVRNKWEIVETPLKFEESTFKLFI